MNKTNVSFKNHGNSIIGKFTGTPIFLCSACKNAPNLYEEGNAKRQYMADGTAETWFTDTIAYVVECDECERSVISKLNMQDSIKKWNLVNEIIL